VSLLQIDHVSKVFGAGGGLTAALRKVGFGIDEGEVVTLIGESGSGKTTLGKIVLRLMQPSDGKVLFGGEDISALRRAQLRDYYRKVQGVFQDPFSSYNPIYKADRVFEMLRDVYFPGTPQAAWDAKIESALHGVALNPHDVLNKYPHQLSGGQLQRLLIARALLLDVKLLVADEIISMLDASTRVDVLNLLVGLKRGGLAILFITHDLSLGSYISDRTVILRHGAVVETGSTVKVFGNPQHSYTKMLLAAVPQLHKKWHAPTAGNGAVGDPSGGSDLAEWSAAHPGGGHAELSAVHLRGGHSHRPPTTRGQVRQTVRDLQAPQLTEFEQDHMVAAEEH
jgi:ABC-type oligopeptide transport system ATPase subunit